MNELLLTTEHGTATLRSRGGLISSWQLQHPNTGAPIDILYRGTREGRTGIPTLFPNYGEGDMYHGFWRDSTCAVTQESSGTGLISLDDAMISADAKRIYPYLFQVRVTVELDTKASMVYTMEVENRETARPIPITPGLHPYWAIAHTNKRAIKTTGIAGFDAAAVDWDTHPPDTMYNFDTRSEIVCPDKTIRIEDITPGGAVIRHMVVWSQPLSLPDHDFVCFEPITGGNNAIKTNPILVQPTEKWMMKLRFSCIL